MWFSVCTLATIYCLLVDSGQATKNWNLIFKDRSHSDWTRVWHQERFPRCRETIKDHMAWACGKDIYRINRRSSEEFVKFPWIQARKAKRFFRNRKGSSITNECCKSSGCTWEEYAEYCPNNKRYY